MIVISANDLKRKGVSAFAGQEEIFVTVRGKPCYVVMDIATYKSLREAKLEIALLQARADFKNRKYIIESVVDHIKRVSD